jgi:hypothetical protein
MSPLVQLSELRLLKCLFLENSHNFTMQDYVQSVRRATVYACFEEVALQRAYFERTAAMSVLQSSAHQISAHHCQCPLQESCDAALSGSVNDGYGPFA